MTDLVEQLRLPKWWYEQRCIMLDVALEGLAMRGFRWEECECGGTGKILTGSGSNPCECYRDGGFIRHPNLKQAFIDNVSLRNKNKLIIDQE